MFFLAPSQTTQTDSCVALSYKISAEMVCWSDPSWMRMAFVGVSWHFHPRRFSKSGLVGFGGALVVNNGHGMEVGFCLHLYHLLGPMNIDQGPSI